MRPFFSINLVLGLLVALFALVLTLVWIPLDTTSGIVEQVRRQQVIGDALAPTVAGVFLLVGAVLVLIAERRRPAELGIDTVKVAFVLGLVAILAVSFLIMRYAGPLSVAAMNVLTGQDLGYRPLRGSFPWKYIGYFLGTVFAVAGIMSLTEGRLGGRALLIGVSASIVLILLYDLPFDDLLLPPNGDL